ncbi:MAG TPA: OsmC family protein [Elusimicrobiales bacterium]|nr:OsmC family protein [Elusimicrobiales bacterium]
MGVKIEAVYVGDQRVELTHGPSGERISTDLPEDNGGRGRTFSPTDLFACSLASCVLTIMAKVAERDGTDLKGASIEIEKSMGEGPRRITALTGTITLPAGITAAERARLAESVKACPVHRSLHPDIKVEFDLRD